MIIPIFGAHDDEDVANQPTGLHEIDGQCFQLMGVK